jgi:hypothetical protein
MLLVLLLLIALIGLFALGWVLIRFAENVIRPPNQTIEPKGRSVKEDRA